jgi:protein TonB
VRTLRDRAAGDINRGAGIAGSLALHGMAIATAVILGREAVRVSSLPAYRVELVAAPRSGTEAAPAAAPQPPTPAPAVAKPAPAHPAPAPSRPQPAPISRPLPPPAARPSAAAPPAAPTTVPGAPTPNTNAAPGTGTDAATIRTEGVEFPFPGYLRNLVAQVYRRWRPPAGNTDLEAEMLFFVHRDGSISGLQFVRRSGAFAFDLEAQGAVESAARAGAFGSLPSGFGPDLLPVSFFFSPRSLR